MAQVLPYSIKVFLVKLLADKGKIISLVLSLLIALGYINEQQGQNMLPIIIGVGTVLLGWIAEPVATKDLQDYKDYANSQQKQP